MRGLTGDSLPGDSLPGDSLPGVVARLTDDEPLDRRTRAGLVARLAVLLARQGRKLGDAVVEIAPHIPVRDRPTLHRHFPGMDDEAIARQLIATAARKAIRLPSHLSICGW